MKRISNYIFIIVFAGITLQSCDYVEKPYQSSDTTIDTGTAVVQRNVLLEEFTGHRCGPCPGAGVISRDLEAYYTALGKHFIPVSIHAGTLAEPTVTGNFITDFRTPDGDAIANTTFLTLPYTPVGFVNRIQYSGLEWIDSEFWISASDTVFSRPVFADMDMTVTFDTTTMAGTLEVLSTFLSTSTNDFYMVAYLVQDSIVGWQVNGTSTTPSDPSYAPGDIDNYVHRHVFRGCLTGNGVNGEEVISGGVIVGQQFTNTINFDVDNIVADFPANAPAINKKQLHAVVYIYNVTTKEIVQVIEEHLH